MNTSALAAAPSNLSSVCSSVRSTTRPAVAVYRSSRPSASIACEVVTKSSAGSLVALLGSPFGAAACSFVSCLSASPGMDDSSEMGVPNRLTRPLQPWSPGRQRGRLDQGAEQRGIVARLGMPLNAQREPVPQLDGLDRSVLGPGGRDESVSELVDALVMVRRHGPGPNAENLGQPRP